MKSNKTIKAQGDGHRLGLSKKQFKVFCVLWATLAWILPGCPWVYLAVCRITNRTSIA